MERDWCKTTHVRQLDISDSATKLSWMEQNAGKPPPMQFKLGLNGEAGTKILILAKPRGSGSSKDCGPTSTSPLDGVGDGAFGQTAVPIPSPFICTGVTRTLNTQCWESLVMG